MLALSIVAPNGSRIAAGHKSLEIRSWRPPQLPLRNLLVVENRIFLRGEDEIDLDGLAVAVVDVDDVHAWQPSERDAACWTHWEPGLWAWQLSRVRPITGAFPVTARRRLYDAPVSDALRECLAGLRE
ncbi:MAG: ASCH domain-containing protein [Rhodanobacter sp.]